MHQVINLYICIIFLVLRIIPAAADACIISALHIAGQGIPYNENVIFLLNTCLFPNVIKKPDVRFFLSNLVGNKNTVKQNVKS